MIVHVEYTGQLRALAGLGRVAAELPDGTTLRDLFARLIVGGPPDLEPHLLTTGGRIQPTLLVVLDGGALSGHDREATRLHDGASVVLLPPVAGG